MLFKGFLITSLTFFEKLVYIRKLNFRLDFLIIDFFLKVVFLLSPVIVMVILDV